MTRLNCKPGDTARIVGLPPSLADGNDRIVILENLPVVDVKGIPCWALTKPVEIKASGPATFPAKLSDVRLMAGDVLNAGYMPDAHLRPIRDPGHDGSDESKAWLPPVPAPAVRELGVPEAEDRHA